MDHDYIDQFDLIDRYLMGKLAEEERAQFEEHFVDCPRCIDRLKTAKNFLIDLRREASRQASETEDRLRRGAPVFFSQIISRKSSLALAAGFLLLVVLSGSIFMFNQARHLRLEADEARSASAEWQQRYEEERQAASSSDRKREETERELTERIRQLEENLQTDQKPPTEMAATGKGMSPQINAPIFDLQSVRGNALNPSEIYKEIALPRHTVIFLMSVPLEGEVNYKDYYVTILNDDRVIWKGNGLDPKPHGALTALFSSSFFRPGKYLLKAEGIDEKGNRKAIGDYPFRVTKNL